MSVTRKAKASPNSGPSPSPSSSASPNSSSRYETPCESPSFSMDSTTVSFSFPFSGASMDAGVESLESNRSTPSVETTCTLRARDAPSRLNSRPTEAGRFDPNEGFGSNLSVNRRLAALSLMFPNLGSSSETNGTLFKGNGPIFEKLQELNEQCLHLVGLEKQLEMISLQMSAVRHKILGKTSEICAILFQNHVQTVDNCSQTSLPHPIEVPAVTSTTPAVDSRNNNNKKQAQTHGYASASSRPKDKWKVDLKPCRSIIPLETVTKFRKLPALVKGFLTRRLMKTEKVQDIIKTIQDTTELLHHYKGESVVEEDDILLHERLMLQLNHSVVNFHYLFFVCTKAEQMQYISRSRELLQDRNRMRTSSVLSNSSISSNIPTAATLKYIQRKNGEKLRRKLDPDFLQQVNRDNGQASSSQSISSKASAAKTCLNAKAVEFSAKNKQKLSKNNIRPSTAPTSQSSRSVGPLVTKENEPVPTRRSTRVNVSKPQLARLNRKLSPRK